MKMTQYMPKNISPDELNSLLENKVDKPFIIDVREIMELEIAPFPFCNLHLPLSQSFKWVNDLNELLPQDRTIVVLCHAGVRSLNFAIWLLKNRLHSKVYNLDGGIDAWSVEVDPSISRY